MEMNEEVKKLVICETEAEMMKSICPAERRIILQCAKTLNCEHSRETIARRLAHDSGLWNEVWGSAKEKMEFWKTHVASMVGTDYARYLESLNPMD